MERRSFLRNISLLFTLGVFSSLPQRVFAAMSPAFSEKTLDGAMKGVFSAETYENSDKILFKAPEIAENGAVVPVSAQYSGEAKKIAFFVEGNPQPLVAVFNLTPKSVPNVSTRIKMGKSSLVHAVVETADGKLLGTNREVKVTIGGCGG